ncbi:MAG: histidine kinase [Acidobacteriales bacterium]|nr:histidine kinase [Terriglobales bacterium]
MGVMDGRWRRFAIVVAVSFAAWMSLAVLQSGQRLARGLPLREAILVPLLTYTWATLCTPAVYYYVRRFPLLRGRLRKSIAAHFVGAALLIVLGASRFAVIPYWNPATGHWHQGSIEAFLHVMFVLRIVYVENVGTYVLIAAVTHAFEYAERYRDRELRESELQRLLAEQRLELLRAQLHPHFLFNTLHGITTLMTRNVPSAREMLLRLSDLLRAVIRYQGKDVVTLREELAFLERYTAIECMRFDDRLRIVTRIDPKTLDCFVPCMILQPLVENAIKHGIGKLQSGGTVTISSAAEDSRLTLCVTNPLPRTELLTSSHGQTGNGDGIGLRNTRARLFSLYGPEAELTFSADHGSGMAETLVRIPSLSSSIPLREAEDVTRAHS